MKRPTETKTDRAAWPELRARIEAVNAAIGRALEAPADGGRAVLEERARRLAQPAPVRDEKERIRVVTFRVAGERYAIEARVVREVTKLSTLVPVPGAPRWYFGVTTWRGEVLPVLDLRSYLGHSSRGVSDLSVDLVLGRTERPELGVLADAVDAVVELEVDALGEPPGGRAGRSGAVLRGVTQDALAVLDGAMLLEDPRLFVNEEKTW